MVKPEIENVEETRSIFCLKNREDMERIEEEEDCFILDFDPFEQIEFVKLSLDSPEDDTDLAVVAEKRGKVACRDYPHPRHVCAKYPFEKTSHEKYCEQCYCVICNKPAPCEQWKEPLKHCSATHRIDLNLKTAPRGVIPGSIGFAALHRDGNNSRPIAGGLPISVFPYIHGGFKPLKESSTTSR